MEDLIHNTQDLEITADLLMLASKFSEWKTRKPTQEITELSMAFSRVAMYVSSLQFERKSYRLAIENVKEQKNNEIMEWRERAKVAERALASNPLNL